MIKMLIKKGLVLLVIAINIHNVRLGEFSPTEAPQPTIKMGYSSARGPAPSGKAASEREGGHSDTRAAQNPRGSPQSRETAIGAAGRLPGAQTEAIAERAWPRAEEDLLLCAGCHRLGGSNTVTDGVLS